MFVCLCHGISDRRVRDLIKQGLSSVKEIQSQCNAGGDCGKCLCQIKQMVREETSNRQLDKTGND